MVLEETIELLGDTKRSPLYAEEFFSFGEQQEF
jgi:hypothetical protein